MASSASSPPPAATSMRTSWFSESVTSVRGMATTTIPPPTMSAGIAYTRQSPEPFFEPVVKRRRLVSVTWRSDASFGCVLPLDAWTVASTDPDASRSSP